MSVEALVSGRRSDSEVRRKRVAKAVAELAGRGEDISVSAVARAAGVHRSFIYRHKDLHADIVATAANAAEEPTLRDGQQVSRRSLMADLANALDRCNRLIRLNATLERRLSEVLGQAAWQQTGLGAPTDIEALERKVARLEQQVVELVRQLAERTDELEEARLLNRELAKAANRQR
jgi:hypothetical protein